MRLSKGLGAAGPVTGGSSVGWASARAASKLGDRKSNAGSSGGDGESCTSKECAPSAPSTMLVLDAGVADADGDDRDNADNESFGDGLPRGMPGASHLPPKPHSEPPVDTASAVSDTTASVAAAAPVDANKS